MKIWNSSIIKGILLFFAFSLIPTSAFALEGDEIDAAIQDMMADVNAQLQADGAEYLLGAVGYYTSGEGNQIGRIVYFKDVGNKQQGAHFVPGDPGLFLKRNLCIRLHKTKGPPFHKRIIVICSDIMKTAGRSSLRRRQRHDS